MVEQEVQKVSARILLIGAIVIYSTCPSDRGREALHAMVVAAREAGVPDDEITAYFRGAIEVLEKRK